MYSYIYVDSTADIDLSTKMGGRAVPPTGFAGSHGHPTGSPKMGFHMPPHTRTIFPEEESETRKGGAGVFGGANAFDFSEKSIRRAFIRKVYGILSIQLLLTTSIIALLTLHEGTKEYVKHSPGLVLVSYIFSIVVLIAVMCCESVRRQSPANVILLGLFTLTYGFVIGVIASQYELSAVALAGVITTLVTFGLTAFSFQTKIDFTSFRGALVCCALIMLIFGIIVFFLPQATIANKVYACLGALLFAFYLIYDTQLMIGGNHKFSISPEEYILAAIHIYMDVIMIFLHLLRLFSSRD